MGSPTKKRPLYWQAPCTSDTVPWIRDAIQSGILNIFDDDGGYPFDITHFKDSAPDADKREKFSDVMFGLYSLDRRGPTTDKKT